MNALFNDKVSLRNMIEGELAREFEWERHLWPLLISYVPEEPGSKIFHAVRPEPVPIGHDCAIAKKFIKEQVDKVGPLVETSVTLEELIFRLETEIEVL